MLLVDAFSSSEALGMGQSVSSAGGTSKTAKFSLGDNARVIDENGRDITPGSGAIGRVAVKGRTPVGYYKDPEKSAKTFVEIDGIRYAIPGDYARVETDNRLTLLGRGSNCINTGGEKVYPEEVEAAIKAHPDVYDTLVVGIPDERYGQAVAAVVQPRPGATIELEGLRTFLRAHLSGYKLPRALTIVDEVPRNATGKAQYPKAKEIALATQATAIEQDPEGAKA
jgi:acyl-CoA synthetase (AMP-forming)/AMP-acid ligase II